MELEVENLWVQSTRHDFDDKKNHQKILFFSCRKMFRRKLLNFFFEIFSKWKIFIEKSIPKS